MKVIKYKFLSYETETEQVFMDVSIACKTQAEFDANYIIAEKEAVGEIVVEGEFDPEQDNTTTDDVLNALLGVTV